MNLITYWGYIFIVFIVLFVPGFAIATRFRNLSASEQIGISFGFSFIIFALLVPFFVFSHTSLIVQLFLICIAIVSIWYLLKTRIGFRSDRDVKFIVLVFVVGLISKFFLQIQWEYPVMGGDWFWHTFSLPYSFEQGNWMPPRDRTQLFSILIYSIQKLLGTSLYQYWVSQIISVVMNSVYVFPAYLIAKKAFGDWVARVSIIFMLVTPFLVFNTLYTWPKNAAMYGVLMMIYFLFFSELNMKLRYSLAGFFGGLGFWFHNYAMFYIAIAVMVLICKEKRYKLMSKNISINLRNISCFLLVLFIVLTPYFVWIYSYYGTLSTSRFIYYPFAVKGYDSALLGDKRELFDTFYSTPIEEIIMIRVSNAIVTLTPAALPINPIAAGFLTYNPIYYYTHDYPGALSTLMYLVVAVMFFKYLLGRTRINSVLVVFTVLPIFIYLFLYGWREWGLLTGGLHPTIPLFIILGFNELYKSYNQATTKLLVVLMFIVATMEGIRFFIVAQKFYYIEGGLTSINNLLHQVVPNAEVSNFISAYFLLIHILI